MLPHLSSLNQLRRLHCGAVVHPPSSLEKPEVAVLMRPPRKDIRLSVRHTYHPRAPPSTGECGPFRNTTCRSCLWDLNCGNTLLPKTNDIYRPLWVKKNTKIPMECLSVSRPVDGGWMCGNGKPATGNRCNRCS